MSTSKQPSKAHVDRLVELEEQMLYLVEVPDSIRFLETRLEEISQKVVAINAETGRLDKIPIQELLTRVDTLETKVVRTGNYERGDSSMTFVAHIEECMVVLDSFQKMIMEIIEKRDNEFTPIYVETRVPGEKPRLFVVIIF